MGMGSSILNLGVTTLILLVTLVNFGTATVKKTYVRVYVVQSHSPGYGGGGGWNSHGGGWGYDAGHHGGYETGGYEGWDGGGYDGGWGWEEDGGGKKKGGNKKKKGKGGKGNRK